MHVIYKELIYGNRNIINMISFFVHLLLINYIFFNKKTNFYIFLLIKINTLPFSLLFKNNRDKRLNINKLKCVYFCQAFKSRTFKGLRTRFSSIGFYKRFELAILFKYVHPIRLHALPTLIVCNCSVI